MSFGDSLVLKSHWWPGHFELRQQYDYEPERIIDIVGDVDRAYRDVLGLGTYAVLAQGVNAYYQDPLLHISASKNHVSLNSLGLPFAQLLAIDAAARTAIREGYHGPFDLYIDSACLHSLQRGAIKRRWLQAKASTTQYPSQRFKLAVGSESPNSPDDYQYRPGDERGAWIDHHTWWSTAVLSLLHFTAKRFREFDRAAGIDCRVCNSIL